MQDDYNALRREEKESVCPFYPKQGLPDLKIPLQ
jgi:hypothetical protein